MTQTHIPTELVRAILAELGVRFSSRDDWRPEALAACCLVSRRMFSLAQAELYHSVSLTIEVREKRGAPEVRPKRLPKIIQSNPHIAAVVRQLWITESPGARGSSTTRAMVGACQRLEGFVWEDSRRSFADERNAGWLEPLMKMRGNTLRSLKVKGRYSWTAALFVDMLRHLPLLRSLTLTTAPYLDDESIQLPQPSFRLQTLDLSEPTPSMLLDLLLGASQESLVTLHFHGTSTGDVYDFSTFTSLRTIHLACHFATMFHIDVARLFQALGSVPSLETVNLGEVCDIRQGTQILEEVDFLRLLPPSILHIHTGSGIILSQRYFAAFLEDRSCLPSLKTLDTQKCYRVNQVRGKMVGERVDANELAAKARGLTLSWKGLGAGRAGLVLPKREY